jgi:hypothetical protein
MKRYMFYTGGYSSQFHVMAESIADAKVFLKQYLKEQDIIQGERNAFYFKTKKFEFPNVIEYPSGRKVNVQTFEEWYEQEGHYLKQFENLTRDKSIFVFPEGLVSETQAS